MRSLTSVWIAVFCVWAIPSQAATLDPLTFAGLNTTGNDGSVSLAGMSSLY